MSGSIVAMIRASDYTNRKALVEQELRRWADALRATPYEDCASSAGVNGLNTSDTTPYYSTTNNGNTLLAVPGTQDVTLTSGSFMYLDPPKSTASNAVFDLPESSVLSGNAL